MHLTQCFLSISLCLICIRELYFDFFHIGGIWNIDYLRNQIIDLIISKRNASEMFLNICVNFFLVKIIQCNRKSRHACRRSRNPCDRRICGDEAQHLADSGLRPVHVGELEGGDSRCDCSECCLDELRVSRCEVKNRSDGLGESGCNASQAFQDARNHRSELAHQVSDTFEEFHDRRPDAFCIIGDVLRDGVNAASKCLACTRLDILELGLHLICLVLHRVSHLAVRGIGRSCGILHGRDIILEQLSVVS